MPRVRKPVLFPLAAVIGSVALLWGCNGSDIDDPDMSDSLLIVQSVSPASVQADVSPTTDPNTMFVQPPADDTVDVMVENKFRGVGAGGKFSDIFIDSFDIACAAGSLQLSGPTTGLPASLTVPANSTGTITVILAPGPYKSANMGALLAIGADTCTLTFRGEDLGGEPVRSTNAVVGLSYVDTP